MKNKGKNMYKFSDGHSFFKEHFFKNNEEHFLSLVTNGQAPKALFIGCSDSRVIPDLILGTKPGDLFVVRNVGNFVPPYNYDDVFQETASAIEYAVSVLAVSEIIVCGHTHCGACATLHYPPEKVEYLPHLKRWLKIAEKAKDLALETEKTGEELLRETEEISVVLQLEHLLTYPIVYKKFNTGELHIHGWIFDIESGAISSYNPDEQKFVPLI